MAPRDGALTGASRLCPGHPDANCKPSSQRPEPDCPSAPPVIVAMLLRISVSDCKFFML